MKETIMACPFCDSSQVSIRAAGYGGSRGYYCDSCKQRFNKPIRRVRYANTVSRSGLAAKLCKMDPDEV